MELLTKIKLLQRQCEEHKYGCNNCPYLYGKYQCKVKDIIYLMCRHPQDWDLKKIEEIFNA